MLGNYNLFFFLSKQWPDSAHPPKKSQEILREIKYL